MKPKTKLMIGALAVVVAGAVLVGGNLGQSVAYFRRPSELKTLPAKDLSKRMRLGGVVMPGSIVKHKGSSLKEFVLFEKDTGVRVRFNGILPDLFMENKPALAEGVFDDGVFLADTVMAKHDENYTPAEMGAMRPEDLTAPPLNEETEQLIFTGTRQ